MMTLLPEKRRWNRRIANLPTAKHNCQTYGIWVRKPKTTGKLACVVCGKP